MEFGLHNTIMVEEIHLPIQVGGSGCPMKVKTKEFMVPKS